MSNLDVAERRSLDDLTDRRLLPMSKSLKGISRTPTYRMYAAGGIPVKHKALLECICRFIKDGETEGLVPLKKVSFLASISTSSTHKILQWLDYFGIIERVSTVSRQGVVIRVNKRPEEFIDRRGL